MKRIALTLLLAVVLSACASSASAPQAPTIQSAPDQSPPAASAQAATAPSAAAPAGGVVITFGAQEDERQVYQPLIDTFNAQNPDLRVQFVSLSEIMNAASGPNQAFDPQARIRGIVSAADTAVTWSVSLDMVNNGLVRDLKPLIDADPAFDVDDYWAGALSAGEIDGGTYLLPRTMRIRLLTYNKDLFAARGVTEPQPDWSWEDLLSTAEQLAQKDGDTVATYGLLDWSPENTVLFGELARRGVQLWSTPSDQVRFDTPEMTAALERTKALVDSGAIYYQQRDPTGAISSDQFQPLITDQQAAIWPLELLSMGPQAPALPFATGTALFPQLPVPFWNGGSEGYVMSSGTPHPNEAWRWLSWLSRQQTAPPVAAPDAPLLVPARTSVADAARYWSTLDAPVADAVKAALEQPQAPLSNNDGHWYEPLTTAMQDVLRGTRDTQAALNDAQQSLEQLLAQASPSPAAAADTSPVEVATPVSEQAPAGTTTITFGAFGSDPLVVRRIAREFNQGNTGVWVEVKENQLGAGPPSLADVAPQVDCFNWWEPLQTNQLNATLDLKPLIDADAAFPHDEYPSALWTPYTRGDAVYGLPQAVSFYALRYNPQAFEAVGLEPPSIDWTLDEFVAAAHQLTSGQGDSQQFGYVSIGGQPGDLMFFIQQAGASILSGSGDTAQPTFTDPDVVKAISSYFDLLKTASLHTKLLGYARSDVDQDTYSLVTQGRVGMWFDPGFAYDVAGFEHAYMPTMAPLPLGGRLLSPEIMTVRGLHISAGSDNVDACWTWLKHLGGQAGQYDGYFPARRTVRDDLAFAAVRTIAAAHPAIRILVVTMFQDDESVFAAMRAGARGYVLKDMDDDDIGRAILAVGRGDAIFSPAIAARMMTFFAARPAQAGAMFPELSDSERKVLRLMAQGVNNQGIAEGLALSPKTVRNYISSIFGKLQVADRAQAIVRARDAGLQ